MKVFELNLDGLVGPTHNYAGLSLGNNASTSNALSTSNPQVAARQGLEKMRLLYSMGLKQAFLPPQQRPNLALLHQLGFSGNPAQQIQKAAKIAPQLLAASYSASSMWTANAATIAPSSDTEDVKVHFTAANLLSNLHRQQEAKFSQKLLQMFFANPDYFVHHEPLPNSSATMDEGAANHIRLCASHAQPAVHLFVYGKQNLSARFPARQSFEACAALARKHLLDPKKVVFACQNPHAIDLGIFHNDVISVANESVFLLYEQAFSDQKKVLAELQNKADFPIQMIQFTQDQFSIEDAVATYLFNSQLITLPDSKDMLLLAPSECQNNAKVQNSINALIADKNNPITQVLYIDLKQSMRNGGGPACLRLRIPLNERELEAMHQGILVNNELLDKLDNWVLQHYRTELYPDDLRDPQLINESFQALDELTQLLNLGSIYPFQSLKENL